MSGSRQERSTDPSVRDHHQTPSALVGEGHRLGGELLGRGAEETVVVALGGHRPAEAEASEQQREAHEREQDADDEGDRAAPAWSGAAWFRWWGVGGHGCALSGDMTTSWPPELARLDHTTTP